MSINSAKLSKRAIDDGCSGQLGAPEREGRRQLVSISAAADPTSRQIDW